ncbi:hypothetical protein BKA69DRAFT_294058 [Paraphysoderma sedebokerense]|nr:hypothetical protein BKA69DRAFT_294058 [Paraphysoderma sedebokerense]
MAEVSPTTPLSPPHAPNPIPPITRTIPKLISPNEVKSCGLCKKSFYFFRSKHNCRNCGFVFCAACSSRKFKLPKFGYLTDVRVCLYCIKYLEISVKSAFELSHMPVRILNDYLQAYNIQTNYALEKTDLVKLIYETQLNDSHESFFRSNCPGSTSQTNSAESVNLSNPANATNTNRRNSRDTTSGNHSRQRSNSVPAQNSSSQTRPRPRTQSTAPSNLQPNTFPEEFFQQFAAQLSQTINEATRQNQSSYSASAPTSPQQPASFPQPKPTDSPPSIETVVKDKLDVTKFSPKLLISILKDNHVDVKNVLEKTELLSKNPTPPQEPTKTYVKSVSPHPSTASS